jgi:hypothetical protein
MDLIVLDGKPIGVSKINFKITKKEKDFINKLPYFKNNDDVCISTNISIFDDTNFKRIKEIMNKNVEEYKTKMLGINDELKVVHSWATLNDNTNHYIHNHKNSLISAVFYLENEGENKIRFSVEKSPLLKCGFFDYKINNYNWFNSEIWEINIEKGMVIMFLSDLKHESLNKGKKTMVGANYFLTGEIGSHKETTYLKI